MEDLKAEMDKQVVNLDTRMYSPISVIDATHKVFFCIVVPHEGA